MISWLLEQIEQIRYNMLISDPEVSVGRFWQSQASYYWLLPVKPQLALALNSQYKKMYFLCLMFK